MILPREFNYERPYCCSVNHRVSNGCVYLLEDNGILHFNTLLPKNVHLILPMTFFTECIISSAVLHVYTCFIDVFCCLKALCYVSCYS